MHSVFLSGCVRQGWSQGCLHSWARWILTPSLLSTLPCFMSPAVLIFYTLFNSLPYNIHLYNKPRVTVKNWPCSCFVESWDFWEVWCGYFFFFSYRWRSESDYKSLNYKAKFIFRAMCNRSCSLRKAYNFLFTMRPRSIRL